MELFKWSSNPNRSQIFQIWNAAKSLGEIPKSWTFSKHGEIRRVWGGFVLVAE